MSHEQGMMRTPPGEVWERRRVWLCCARRGLIRTVLNRDRPGFGLLFVADRTIGVAQADVNGAEVVFLEKGRHRHPLGRRRVGRRDMFANAAHSQRRYGCHVNTSPTTLTVEGRYLFKGVQLGASLGASDASPVTE